MAAVGQCQLLRYVLGRQGLLQRFDSTKDFLSDTPWSDVGPLHATSPQTPYLSLLARIEDFTDEWREFARQNLATPVFEDAKLWPSKHYFRSRCMRGTLHMLPAHIAAAVNTCYDRMAIMGMDRFGVDVTDEGFAEWSSALLHKLYVAAACQTPVQRGKKRKASDDEDFADTPSAIPSPATAVHLREHFMPKGQAKRKCPIYKASKCKLTPQSRGSGCRMKWMLQWLWGKGLVEHGADKHHAEIPHKQWRSTSRTWSISSLGAQQLDPANLLESSRAVVDRLLAADLDSRAKQAAELDLCIWYFSLYGPASFKDYQWWSGLTPVKRLRDPFNALLDGVTRPAINAPHGPHFKLVEVSVAGMPETLYMMKSQLPSLLATSAAPITGMARLLPYEDAIIKAYKETRYRFYPAFRYGTRTQDLSEEPKAPAAKVRKTRASTKVTTKKRKAVPFPVDVSNFSEPTVIVRGEAMPTVWLDGCIAGVWKWRNKPDHPVAVTLMLEASAEQRQLLEQELTRVGVLVEQSDVEWL